MPTTDTIPMLLPTKQTEPAGGRTQPTGTTTAIQTAEAGRSSYLTAVLHPTTIQEPIRLLLPEAAAAEAHHRAAAVPVLLYQGRAEVNASSMNYNSRTLMNDFTNSAA